MRRRTIAALTFASAALVACTSLKIASISGDDAGQGEAPPGEHEGDDDGGARGSDADTPKHDAGPNAPFGRPCTEAECPPETVADGLHGPVALAVNANHVFWIEVGTSIPNAHGYGQLIRLPKGVSCSDRSCFEVVHPAIIPGELEGRYIYDTHLALGPLDLCYTQSFNASPAHEIGCFSLETLKRRSLANSTGAAVALWVGATEARWAIGAMGDRKGEIRGRPLDGGAVATIVPDLADPTSVTSAGSDLFWTERAVPNAPTGRVSVLRQDGGISVLADNRMGPIAAKVYGPHLYWLEYASRLVMRVRIDGTGAPEQIATTDPHPFALVVDASGVYWASAGAAETGSEGSVAHAPHAPGGPTTTMMSSVRNIYDLAADDEHIYVSAIGARLGQGKILRMRKVP